MGKGIAVLLALLTAVMVAGCGSSGEVKTVVKTVESAPAEDPADAPEEGVEEVVDEEEETGPAAEAPVGRWAKVDGIRFMLKAIEDVDQIPTSWLSDGPIVPARGSKLWKATVVWKNETRSSIDVFCGGQGATLIDNADRNFEHDSDAGIEIEDNAMCGDAIQPGFKTTTTLVFRMPAKAKPNSLVMWNSEEAWDPVNEGRYVQIGPLS